MQLRLPCRRCWSFFSDQSGGALIETALFFSFFCLPVMLATYEIGQVNYDSIEVEDAAYAGAMYGMQSQTLAADTTDIQAAAQAESPDYGTNMSVNSAIVYVCSSAVTGTQYASASAASSCSTALEFVKVNTSVTSVPRFHIPGMPATYNLQGQAMIEVQH